MTLEAPQSSNHELAGLAHDARNMVTALMMYCELLDQPGVLTASNRHYAEELRMVTTSCGKMVEKLVAAGSETRAGGTWIEPGKVPSVRPTAPAAQYLDRPDNEPIQDLREELLANRNLLEAMAGQGVAVKVSAVEGARPVRLTGEDLTRVLVNLVKNASEALHASGRIEVHLCERSEDAESASTLVLTVSDSGPGIPANHLESIFMPGFTTHARGTENRGGGTWPVHHRGLGLAITRSILEAAGGRILASNGPGGGAWFEIELPVRSR